MLIFYSFCTIKKVVTDHVYHCVASLIFSALSIWELRRSIDVLLRVKSQFFQHVGFQMLKNCGLPLWYFLFNGVPNVFSGYQVWAIKSGLFKPITDADFYTDKEPYSVFNSVSVKFWFIRNPKNGGVRKNGFNSCAMGSCGSSGCPHLQSWRFTHRSLVVPCRVLGTEPQITPNGILQSSSSAILKNIVWELDNGWIRIKICLELFK